jgi:hypothetical protein
MDQSELNKEMTQIGVGRFNSQWESARDNDDLSRSKAGQKILRELLPEFHKRVKQLLKKKQGRPTRWQEDLRKYDSKKVAFLHHWRMRLASTLKER